MQNGSFLNFKDMFDGGGMGKAGSQFQGGGLLSDIGNALFKPFGQGQRMQQAMQETRPQMRPQQPTMSTSGAPKEYGGRGDYGMMPPQPPSPNSMTPDAADPRGNYWTPNPYQRPAAPQAAPMPPVADPMAPYQPVPPTMDAYPVMPMGSMTTPPGMGMPVGMGGEGGPQMTPEMYEVMKYLLEQK